MTDEDGRRGLPLGGSMQVRFPRARRAYLTSLAAGVGTFAVVVVIIHGLLTSMGLRAEATYLDDFLVAVVVALLVLALEAYYEAHLRAERERSLLSLGLNHHVRNALQTIVYVSSTMPDRHQAEMLRDAAKRIEWAVREVPKQAQADEPVVPEWKPGMGDSRTSNLSEEPGTQTR